MTRDPEEATDGPPDPQLAPQRSPGWGEKPEGLEDVEVSRDDVTIGEADPRDLTASDTEPVEDETTATLLGSLAEGDAVDRQRAALALVDAEGDADAIAAGLASAALEDDHADVRQFAVEALGKRGGDVALDTARFALEDDDPWVRAEAVVALDRRAREEHAAVIEEALADDHHAVRRNALISLFKLRGEGAAEELLAHCDDDSERVREWAAHLLAGVESDAATERLRALAAEDDSQIVRSTATTALQTDARAFRRGFSGAIDEQERTLPGEDALNRTPDL
jgi:HEAT repeat protein